MRALAAVMVLGGCAREREPVPVVLDDLAASLFRDWDDTARIEEHASELKRWLDEPHDADAAWDGLRLTNLTADDVASVEYPEETDLSLHGGIATLFSSLYPIEAHAALLVEPDQTFTDPNSFLVYERTVVDGDAAAFVGGSGMVRTENVITKGGPFGIEIPYDLRKDYRWVEHEEATVLIGRTWLTEPGCSGNGRNCVLQSWGIDTFVANGQQTRRLYAVWIEARTEADSLLGEDAKLGLIASGNQDLLLATDEELGQR